MYYHILLVHTINFFFMCGQLFVCEILLSSADMCYRIFCVYFVFFSSCAITFFVCMHHNIEQICLCGNVLHFYSVRKMYCVTWLKLLKVCHIPHVERDNVVYWKTKRKIKNDLQCTAAPTTPPPPATRVQL